MNRDYKILGIIISGLNKDYPNKVSKNFTDNVMRKIKSKQISNKISFNKTDLLNVAASIFFAIITSIILLDFNTSENNLVVKEVNEKTVDRVLHMMDVDNLGLESIERDILKIIVDRYSGGPVGIEAIATVLGENRKSLESIHEPYLVKLGLMERTRKGRKITEKGYKHIKDISKKS